MNAQTIEIQNEHLIFLQNYKKLGFDNESALVSFAIKFLQHQIKKQDGKMVKAFTNLFMEMYGMEFSQFN